MSLLCYHAHDSSNVLTTPLLRTFNRNWWNTWTPIIASSFLLWLYQTCSEIKCICWYIISICCCQLSWLYSHSSTSSKRWFHDCCLLHSCRDKTTEIYTVQMASYNIIQHQQTIQHNNLTLHTYMYDKSLLGVNGIPLTSYSVHDKTTQHHPYHLIKMPFIPYY